MAKDIKKGCVVYMNADSGMKGYGNPQCVSWVSHELGELSLYGHNEHYKTYDVREVVEPSPEQDAEIVELNRAIVIKVEQCAAKDAEIERLKREIALLESQKRII